MHLGLKQLAAYFFTYTCPSCDSFEYDFAKEPLCSKCMEQLKFIQKPFCHGCGTELDGVLDLCSKCISAETRPWAHAISVFHMKGLGSNLVHRFKYNNCFELGRPLASLAAQAVRDHSIDVDVIVPVPLHWRRQFLRGYNQSEVIAKQLSRELKIPTEKLIARHKHTKQQAKLDKTERENNLIDAFSVIKGANCKKRSILLVDDVMTTGATLTEAAKVLLKEVATEVNVLVLARR